MSHLIPDETRDVYNGSYLVTLSGFIRDSGSLEHAVVSSVAIHMKRHRRHYRRVSCPRSFARSLVLFDSLTGGITLGECYPYLRLIETLTTTTPGQKREKTAGTSPKFLFVTNDFALEQSRAARSHPLA